MKKIFISLLILFNSFVIGADYQVVRNEAFIYMKIKLNDIETIKKFISSNSDINKLSTYSQSIMNYTGRHTYLHEAIIARSFDLVKFFLQSKANVFKNAEVTNPKTIDGTVLQFAMTKITFGKEDEIQKNKIIEILLKYGAKVIDKEASILFSTPITINQAILLDDQKLLKEFINSGNCDFLNNFDKYNFNAIMWAVSRGNVNAVEQIVSYCKEKNIGLEIFVANIESDLAYFVPPVVGDNISLLTLADNRNYKEILNLLKQNALITFQDSNVAIPYPLIFLICDYCT